MRNRTLWALGTVFFAILVYLGWSRLEGPISLFSETKLSYAKVVAVFPSKEVRTYSRKVKYVYVVNGTSYADFEDLGTRDKKQFIGNRLRISYSVNNPSKSSVIKYLNDYRSSREIKFYSSKDEGFFEFRLINGVFTYKEFAEKGRIVDDYMGEYSINGDTLKFMRYRFETVRLEKNTPELFVVDSDQVDQLIEMNTNRIFKEVRSRR